MLSFSLLWIASLGAYINLLVAPILGSLFLRVRSQARSLRRTPQQALLYFVPRILLAVCARLWSKDLPKDSNYLLVHTMRHCPNIPTFPFVLTGDLLLLDYSSSAILRAPLSSGTMLSLEAHCLIAELLVMSILSMTSHAWGTTKKLRNTRASYLEATDNPDGEEWITVVYKKRRSAYRGRVDWHRSIPAYHPPSSNGSIPTKVAHKLPYHGSSRD
jgi:hypothetical protein